MKAVQMLLTLKVLMAPRFRVVRFAYFPMMCMWAAESGTDAPGAPIFR